MTTPATIQHDGGGGTVTHRRPRQLSPRRIGRMGGSVDSVTVAHPSSERSSRQLDWERTASPIDEAASQRSPIERRAKRRSSLRRAQSFLSPRQRERKMEFWDIKVQFAEQLKALEGRAEAQQALLAELQEYFRRRAEVEAEYGKALDKLSKAMAVRMCKGDRPKNEAWPQLSLYQLVQDLLQHTRVEGRQRSVFADVCGNYVIGRLGSQSDAVGRLSKKCINVADDAQKEILRVLGELHTAMKTYQCCHGACLIAEEKFHVVQTAKNKYEEAHPKKKGSRKHKLLVRDYEKRYDRYQENKLKALVGRNEYLLCVDAANAALRKYYADGISDVLDCTDLGLRPWLRTTMGAYASSNQCLLDSGQAALSGIHTWMEALDPRLDKQRFFEANHSLFSLPRKMEFAPQKGDDIRQVTASKTVHDELLKRHNDLSARLTQLRTETEEVWKTLESAERTLLRKVRLPEPNVDESFRQATLEVLPDIRSIPGLGSIAIRRSSAKESVSQQSSGERSKPEDKETIAVDVARLRQELMEMEEFYHRKFREYCLTTNLIDRLSARHDALQGALGLPPSAVSSSTLHANGHATPPSPETESQCSVDVSVSEDVSERDRHHPPLNNKPKKKRIGRSTGVINPKLFGGTIEEYVETTHQEVPLIIRSCIRMLSMYGLHHQGVFRQSGSLPEINRFKEAFERGEDPLVDVTGRSDVNAVAGVLKMYFRELREPLFPIYMFDQFVNLGSDAVTDANKGEFIENMRNLVQSLSRPVFVVMRYLFAFLNHLSEFSDENMMDPFNIAICFGPTLIRVPESESREQAHYTRVNHLIRNMIKYQEDIFPSDGGMVYEKYLMTDKGFNDGPPDEAGNEQSDGGLSDTEDDLPNPHTSGGQPTHTSTPNHNPREAAAIAAQSHERLSTGTHNPNAAGMPSLQSERIQQQHSFHAGQRGDENGRHLIRPISMSSIQQASSGDVGVPIRSGAPPPPGHVWHRRSEEDRDAIGPRQPLASYNPAVHSVDYATSAQNPPTTYAAYKNNSALLQQSSRFSRSLAAPYLRLGVVGYPVSQGEEVAPANPPQQQGRSGIIRSSTSLDQRDMDEDDTVVSSHSLQAQLMMRDATPPFPLELPGHLAIATQEERREQPPREYVTTSSHQMSTSVTSNSSTLGHSPPDSMSTSRYEGRLSTSPYGGRPQQRELWKRNSAGNEPGSHRQSGSISPRTTSSMYSAQHAAEVRYSPPTSGLSRPASIDGGTPNRSLQHPPAPHDETSPSTLHDIQAELKAVLNSLESFQTTGKSHQMNPGLIRPLDDYPRSAVYAHQQRRSASPPVVPPHPAPPPPAPLNWTKPQSRTGVALDHPDLVRNLPRGGSVESRSSPSPPAPPTVATDDSVCAQANYFADSQQSTIRKAHQSTGSSPPPMSVAAAPRGPSPLDRPERPDSTNDDQGSLDKSTDSAPPPDDPIMSDSESISVKNEIRRIDSRDSASGQGPEPPGPPAPDSASQHVGPPKSRVLQKPILRPKPIVPKKPLNTSPTLNRKIVPAPPKELKEITKM